MDHRAGLKRAGTAVGGSGSRSPGRPRSTTREAVGRVALSLFSERGFEETTLDDVAIELGIGRRTLSRYFPSKNDLVWGEFNDVLDRLRAELRIVDPGLPLMEAIRVAAVRSNTYPDDLLDELHRRVMLIQTVPALQAHSMLRYAEWRGVIAEYAANRLGCLPDDLAPLSAGHAAFAASTAAFGRWVAHRDEDILILLDRSYELVATG